MIKSVTVKELIEFLQTHPQDLTVAYCYCSEQVLLDIKDITVRTLCMAREDGWIQNNRADKITKEYLIFPGN